MVIIKITTIVLSFNSNYLQERLELKYSTIYCNCSISLVYPTRPHLVLERVSSSAAKYITIDEIPIYDSYPLSMILLQLFSIIN